MTSHADRAQALAAKVTKKAEDALATIQMEMVIMKWPAEFRAIMWGAVADLANNRRIEAEQVTAANGEKLPRGESGTAIVNDGRPV